jgi:hypothetical protein
VELQRRGAHVNVPKIGSRAGEICFGGIYVFHADLRRDFIWGNLNWGFFWVLGVSPREAIEEGGPLVQLVCTFGGIYGLGVFPRNVLMGGPKRQRPWVRVYLKTTVGARCLVRTAAGEGFLGCNV